LPERYEYVLGRIGLWNGTQDVFETVSQLEDLVESGKKSNLELTRKDGDSKVGD
jgi:hypothetical protein